MSAANKRVKFAPVGRWDLRFAAAPYPRRYVIYKND